MELLAIRLIPQAGKSLVMSKGGLYNLLIHLILRSWFDKLTTNGGLIQRFLSVKYAKRSFAPSPAGE